MRTILQNIQQSQARITPHPVENSKSRIQTFSRKEQEGRLEKICQLSQLQYAYKSSLELSKAVESQRLKKVNILEGSGVQYIDSKNTANKIGNTLTELYLTQTYDPTFLKIKKKE